MDVQHWMSGKHVGARRPSLASMVHELGDITAIDPVTLIPTSIRSFRGRDTAYLYRYEETNKVSWTVLYETNCHDA